MPSLYIGRGINPVRYVTLCRITPQAQRLTAAFLGETGTARIRHPDLQRPKTRGMQLVTIILHPPDDA
jgi:hypothetical protein